MDVAYIYSAKAFDIGSRNRSQGSVYTGTRTSGRHSRSNVRTTVTVKLFSSTYSISGLYDRSKLIGAYNRRFS